MDKNILIIPSFLPDTYSNIEEAYIELATYKAEGINFIWLVRNIDSKYTNFKNTKNKEQISEPLYVNYLRERGIKYLEADISKYNIFKNFLLFRHIFKEYNIHAVYVHFGFERYYGTFFGKIFGKKTIWHEHMYWNAPGMKFIKLKKLFLRTFVDYFISISNFITSTLPSESNIFTVYNAIRFSEESPVDFTEKIELKKKFGINVDKRVVLMVAAFRPTKRYDLAFEICKQVLANRRDVQFVFLGEGTEREEFLKRVQEAELTEDIISPGHVLNVKDYYKIADICMLTSDHEPFGYVIVEALQHSLPFVGFNSGGCKEIVRDKYSGVLIPSENTYAFAERLQELLDNSDLCSHLGSNGYRDVKKRFSRETWLGHMNEIFVKILVN